MIQGEKVCLGPLFESDAPTIFAWHNNMEIMHKNGNYIPTNQRAFTDWFNNLGRDPSTVMLAIRKPSAPGAIGYVKVSEISYINRSGVVGIMIGDPANRGHGYGQESIRLFAQFCWNELNLQRLSLYVFGPNEAAVRAYEKAGFQHEGLLRRAVYSNGTYLDATLMALLR